MMTSKSRVIVEQLDPLNPTLGGIETCVRDILRYSADRITVLGATSREDVTVFGEERFSRGGKEVTFVPLFKMAPGGRRRIIPNSLRLAVGLLRYRGRVDKDATLQAHRMEIGAVLKLLFPGRSRIQFIHTNALAQLREKSESMWKHLPKLYLGLEAFVIPSTRATFVFNKPDGERLQKYGTQVIPMRTWFDPEIFFPGSRTSHSGDMQSDVMRVLWVGRFEDQKNPQLAIGVLAEMIKLGAVKLIMVGEGSLTERCNELALDLSVHEFLHLPGRLTARQVAELMRESHVLLMTSRYEGSPRVLIEANACGLPVVATSGADQDGALRPELNGIRVNSDSPEQLAASCFRALSIPAGTCVDSVRVVSAPHVVPTLVA